MKNIAICFVTFSLIIIISSSKVNTEKTVWTAEELYMLPKETNSQFIDPEHYITNTSVLNEIKSNITHAYSEASVNIYFFVFSKMNDKYSRFLSDKDIDLFTNDLSYLIFEGDKAKDSHSVIVALAIKDRLMKIRTGEYARTLIPDSRCKSFIEDAIYYLKHSDYETACAFLAKKIYQRAINKEEFSSWEKFQDIMVYVCVILFVIACLFTMLRKLFLQLNAVEEKKLNLIKNYFDQNLAPKKFMEEVCAICLEKLIVDQQAIDTNQKGNITSLMCSHSFHQNCIEQWTREHQTCPMCRSHIETEINTKSFYEEMLNIQLIVHPRLRRKIHYTFGQNNFSWNRVVETSGGGRSSYSSGWGSGSGGAKGRW